MEKIIAILPQWLRESNRWKHLVGILVVSFFGTLLMGVGCIFGMEFKDVHHYNGDHVPFRKWDLSAWDLLDVLAGVIGGIIGQAIQLAVVIPLFK